jgi:shikimate dehydrogenase
VTPPAVGAATRLFAVLGDPVSHSLSPTFQNAALRALGLDGVYVALRCSADDVPGLIRGLARAGGGGNVTVPHKEAAARAVDRRTDAVEATGACNTFWSEDGAVWGDNTDVDGFTAAARLLLGRSLADARVLLLGAGGSARAVAHACALHGAERVAVLNRSPDRARDLVRRFADRRTAFETVSSPDELPGPFDLAVNATSLGLKPDDALPLDPAAAPPLEAALDLVYSRTGDTAWTRAMRVHGIPAADGTEMLLQQGAAAFRRWWKVDPPMDVMRAALVAKGG